MKVSASYIFIVLLEVLRRNKMKQVLYLTILFVPFLLSACNDPWEIVYQGNETSAIKISEVLSVYGVRHKRETGAEYSIYVPHKEVLLHSQLIHTLLSISKDTCVESSDLKNLFVPKRIDQVEVVFSKVRNIRSHVMPQKGIFNISCQDHGVTGSPMLTPIVWFDSASIEEVRVQVLLEEAMKVYDRSQEIKFILKDIKKLVGLENHINDLSKNKLSSLVVFEPFSFHILNSEKVSAGIQLMSMLLLFLSSGFILGYWFGKR